MRLAVFSDADRRRWCDRDRLRFALLGALLRALLAIKHISARHFVLTRAHEGKFDLVLDVLDRKSAATGLTAHQSTHDGVGKPCNQLAHACGCRPLTAVDRDKGLGHGDGDLRRLEPDYRTISSDHLVLAIGRRYD